VGSSGFCRQLCDGEKEEYRNGHEVLWEEGDSAWCADMHLCSAFGGTTSHCVSKVRLHLKPKNQLGTYMGDCRYLVLYALAARALSVAVRCFACRPMSW
jgi:hypothetical protein